MPITRSWTCEETEVRESQHATDDAKPFTRGINSIQLLKSGERYWIVEVLWDAETPANPIPAEYLSKR